MQKEKPSEITAEEIVLNSIEQAGRDNTLEFAETFDVFQNCVYRRMDIEIYE